MDKVKIKKALISVFNKDGIDSVINQLNQLGVEIYSTGGTQAYIEKMNVPVKRVEDLTSYPSILGGRVKTLHPKVFGAILNRKDNENDQNQLKEYEIPTFDLVIVDLYPFEDTVAAGSTHQEIIEKIDIGGISLIRAAAKNYNDISIISNRHQYEKLVELLKNQKGEISLNQRKELAMEAFNVSSHYDVHIFNYFNASDKSALKISEQKSTSLRYGENPHQNATFYGDLSEIVTQLHGKELSYNNLLDSDAAVKLMEDFSTENPTFAILKHNNACGLATCSTIEQAYINALAGDPVSAFGGILIANTTIDLPTAKRINEIFCEVVIAPEYDKEALAILTSKKNLRVLVKKPYNLPSTQLRTILNGVLSQDSDTLFIETTHQLEQVTKKSVTEKEKEDLIFANKIVKHTKSNAIILAKGRQLLASGTGQTSRVDALKQAIHKAKSFNFDLNGAVMASDAFFPFPDCVEIAKEEGIKTVIQPGGSIKDKLSIEYCDNNDVAMVFTGYRHFKH